MGRSFVLVSLLGALLLASCDLLNPGSGQTLSFQNVKDAEPLRVQEAQTAVFRREAAWTSFWNDHVTARDSDGEKIAPPSIDFDEHMLIAVFWGNNGYGGCSSFAEAIESVSATSGRVIVSVGRLPDLGPCRMVVFPLQVIKVKRTEQPVEFSGRVPSA